jgi:hypothetical protein
MLSALIGYIIRFPHKYQYEITFKLDGRGLDLNSDPDDIASSNEKLSMLDNWADFTMPIKMNSYAWYADNKNIFIEPGSIHLIERRKEDNVESYVYRMIVKEA